MLQDYLNSQCKLERWVFEAALTHFVLIRDRRDLPVFIVVCSQLLQYREKDEPNTCLNEALHF